MANRAYLYSINGIPGAKEAQSLTLKNLAEWSWDVPLSFLILVSVNPEVCDSLFDEYPEKTSLAGDFEGGVVNLQKFGELMLRKNFVQKEAFESAWRATLNFLSGPEVKQPFVFLELG